MKLNKPVITITFIVLLLVNLIFFSLALLCKGLNTKENVKYILDNFNYKEYILEDINVNNSIDTYKYSNEVFDYIDKDKYEEIENKIIDNLFDKEETIIEENDIKELLTDSVNKYEIDKMIDTKGNAIEDIDNISSNIASTINKEFLLTYKVVNIVSSDLVVYSLLLVAIILVSVIILKEKRNGCLIGGISMLIYSFVAYSINNNLFNIIKLDDKYFNKFDKFVFKLDNFYMICFILSFVLLLIYIVLLIKKILRDKRINSYYQGGL